MRFFITRFTTSRLSTETVYCYRERSGPETVQGRSRGLTVVTIRVHRSAPVTPPNVCYPLCDVDFLVFKCRL